MVPHLTQRTSQCLFIGWQNSIWSGHPVPSLSLAIMLKQIGPFAVLRINKHSLVLVLLFPQNSLSLTLTHFTGPYWNDTSVRPSYLIYSLNSWHPTAHNPLSCFIFHPGTYHHLSHHWCDIYFTYLCFIVCHQASWWLRSLFYSMLFSIILNRNKYSPSKVTEIHDCFQGYTADRNY